ncbi:MAG: nucleotidyltransferase domain-containing protein [Thermodesulfovibrionales bacterium]|nr:nucleotidyltransferase domain-containing protein [Thermodesulfovibrionales bacterium]
MEKKIKKQLKDSAVTFVYQFVSMSSGRTSRICDVYIGIVLKGVSLLKHTRNIYAKLYAIFADIYPSFTIDIVFLQSAPLPLQYNAVRYGRVLFEADPKQRADYEAEVMNMYFDFMPVLRVFDDAAGVRHTHV